jgi:hypothetical protein
MPAASEYRDTSNRNARRSREASLAGRDIGPIPKITNVRRRESTRFDLQKFCLTYNPTAFYFELAEFHRRGFQRIQEAVLQGAMYALAWPRGSGKTTICRMAVLWAASHAHARYPFLVGANAGKGEDSLDAIKTFVRFLPEYAEDFPEVAFPAIKLGGIANRSSGQICEGESTLIGWGKDRVVLPTVPPPANWPKRWKLRADGMAPTSGSVLGVSGLTGDGIRGSVTTLTTGEQLRPDFVLLDDPQTDESAASATQNETRESLVAGAVLGMAGPGKSISAVMPCTVIRPGDFIDRVLDRDKHPMWRGERCRMLVSMPTNLAAWDPYFDLRAECARKEPPDFSEANAYYAANREVLDAGAVASWPERKLPDELSAIQHAMNLYHRNRRAFFAEYQNDPLPDEDREPEIVTAESIAAKVNRLGRRSVPIGCSRLTAMIDVHQAALFWLVAAWSDDFTGAIVDYGAWPDPKRSYFTLADIRHTIMDATKSASLEAALYGGLDMLTVDILGREYKRDGDGAGLSVERCLIDANWQASTETVYKFARQSRFASVITPSHGKGVTASSQPFSNYKKKPGERVGPGWRIPNVTGTRAVRHVLFDANQWKSFVYARLAVPMGGRCGLELFGDRADMHRMLADQLTAEFRDRQTSEIQGRTVDVWTCRPQRDNHLFDCLVGASVAASIQGVTLPEVQAPTAQRPTGKKRISIAELQKQAREKGQ